MCDFLHAYNRSRFILPPCWCATPLPFQKVTLVGTSSFLDGAILTTAPFRNLPAVSLPLCSMVKWCMFVFDPDGFLADSHYTDVSLAS